MFRKVSFHLQVWSSLNSICLVAEWSGQLQDILIYLPRFEELMTSDMEASLEEKSVTVKLSDPWDLGEKLNWKPLSAVILSVDNNDSPENLILRLTSPFEYKNVECEYFVVSTRHENEQLKDLVRSKSVFCGLTRIPESRLQSTDPFDLGWWRGGPALIGELVFE